MGDWPFLTLTTFLPLVGAAAIMAMRGSEEAVARNARNMALWTSLATFVISLFVWFLFDRSSADFQFVEHHDWFPGYDIA